MTLWPLRLLILVVAKLTSGQQLCSVFQPFKVTPEGAKYQIGGPFPLHTEDCLHVRPDVVQELIGVQWALSRWNQNPRNANFKLALSAFDTCSRGQESLTQTMTFLQESGFLSPKECRSVDHATGRVPLGLIMPMAQDGRLKGLKEALLSVNVPILTYSGSTAQALLDAGVTTTFTTAPTLDHYMQIAIGLLKSMQSDLITIIYSDQNIEKATLDKQLDLLSKSRISHTKFATISEPKSIDNPDSNEIILMIGSKDEIINYFMTTPELASLHSKKLFILIPALGESWIRDEIDDFLLPKKSNYRLVIIQQSNLFIEDDFRDYFIDIIRNNYETYVLLATYMQQANNCTLIGTDGMIDCADVDFNDMIKGFRMNRQVESAILATYIYGAIAKYVAEDRQETCETASSACTNLIIDFLQNKMAYTFGESDPPSYRGFAARFGPDRSLISLKIEGLYARRENEERKFDVILNYTTGTKLDTNRIQSSIIRSIDGDSMKVRCKSWLPECQSCLNEKKYELANGQAWIQKSAGIYVLGLFDMRKSNVDSSICNRSIDDPKSILMPAAFVYTLENIRQKFPDLNILPGLDLGSIILDSCHDRITTMETMIATSTDRCVTIRDSTTASTIPSKNIAAIVSGQSGQVSDMIANFFKKSQSKKPIIGSDFESISIDRKSVESMSSNYDIQSKALINLLKKQGWDYVTVLLSEHDQDCMKSYESFRHHVESDGRICIADVVHARSGERIESIRSANAPSTKIALAFTTAQDTILMMKTHQSYQGRAQNDPIRPIYILIGDSHDWEIEAKQQSGAHTWKSYALGALSVQFRHKIDDEFRNYLSNLNPKKVSDKWFLNFWQDYFKCSLKSDANQQKKEKVCTGEEKLPDRFGGRLTKEAYFMSNIDNFILALDTFYKKSCPKNDGLCDEFFDGNYFTNVTEFMAKMTKIDELTIYNYRSNSDNVNGGSYAEIGTYSISNGLKLNDTWMWYDTERNPNTTIPESTCKPPNCNCRQKIKPENHSAKTSSNELDSPNFQIKSKESDDSVLSSAPTVLPATGQQWKKQVWAYIFLIINTILLLAASLVLTIVSVKLCCGIVKGNQSLGICLLFGVILLYLTAYLFIFDACESLCRLRYIAHTFSYAVCFGCMIAKAVQLRNSETLGFNGYISYWNYWLLLFFICAVQMGLSIQWSIVRHPIVLSLIDDAGTNSPTIIMRCSWSNDEFLASQIYVIILLFMATFLALLNRNVKRNYKETRWLMYTSFLCAAIWVAWMIGYAATPYPFKDTVVVMELMTNATVILCFMFGPKLYILLRYESIFNDPAPATKLPCTGPIYGAADSDKRNSMVLATSAMPNKDDGIREFDMDDDEDGQKSVISVDSVKSARVLSHTLSSASSVITCSDDSSSPVIHSGSRKKNRSKRRGHDTSTVTSYANTDPNMTIFEETVASMH